MNKHELPALPYDYAALEPHLDEATMRLHHDKHHQTYVDKLNAALDKHPELAEKSLEELLQHLDTVPEDIRNDVRNHGGGHSNHTLFWAVLKKDVACDGEIKTALESTFGSVDEFLTQLEAAATKVFGSGWAWLVLDNGVLKITTTPNQDSPLSLGHIPLFGIDVWEHAYYLKYQNRRPEYLKALRSVINWEVVNQNYLAAR